MKEAANRGGLISGLFVGVADFPGFRVDQMCSGADRAVQRNTDRIGADQAVRYKALYTKLRSWALKDKGTHAVK
jgi:hypothetical protein